MIKMRARGYLELRGWSDRIDGWRLPTMPVYSGSDGPEGGGTFEPGPFTIDEDEAVRYQQALDADKRRDGMIAVYAAQIAEARNNSPREDASRFAAEAAEDFAAWFTQKLGVEIIPEEPDAP